jgi:TonB family protein
MSIFSRIVLSLIFVGTIALYNFLLVDVRFEELYTLLGSAAAREEALTTFGILAKYESVNNGVAAEDDPCVVDHGQEIKAMISDAPAEGTSWKNDSRVSVRYVVKGIRLLLGKKVISSKEEDPIINVLKIGYFFERNRKYRSALKIYNDVVQTGGVEPAIRVSVMMHKAFCISMLGNYKEAKLIYEQVINQYSADGAGALSWKLIDCIQDMERKREAIETLDAPALVKAQKFYDVMDFHGAVRMFTAAAESGLPANSASEAHYYNGRAHEVLGEVSEAEREYHWVARSNRKSVWAEKADCRLKALDQFNVREKTIVGEAQRRLAAYRDRKFSEKVRSYAQDASQNVLRNELLGGTTQTGPASGQDSLRSALQNIGSADLTDERSAADQQKRLDSIRNALVEKGDTGQAGRKTGVVQNPYRRPTAVKAVIDNHQKELDALYKKRLRNRVKLSGRMLVGFTIRANGLVSRVSLVESDMGDQTFEKEVLRCVWGWKFRPVPASVGDFAIQYPFEFP